MTGEMSRIAGSLRSLGEELDDLAFDRLREAVADGEIERPPDDKRIMQARRAIEKAAAILDSLD
ncbi:MAG: hypothetical protein AAGF91_04985 [Actinomycetota bacterium]